MPKSDYVGLINNMAYQNATVGITLHYQALLSTSLEFKTTSDQVMGLLKSEMKKH